MKLKGSILIKLTIFAAFVSALASAWLLYTHPDTRSLGLPLLGVSGFLLLLFFTEALIYRKILVNYIAKSAQEITKTERESLYLLPAPAVIVDPDGNVLWANEAFDDELVPRKQIYGKKLSALLDTDIKKTLSPDGEIMERSGRYYRARAVAAPGKEQSLLLIYYTDITDFIELDYEYHQSYPSVLLVMIDNYEDLMQNVRESEKAHTLVEIEKLMEGFIDMTTGVVRRVSNSLFFCVVEERHLSAMIDQRFPILDKARSIQVGERLTVTLSIGVGRGAKNLSESETYAKQALDMCLGRGGDQAAVKTENGFEFFGGVSKGVEKHTKVKTRIIATAIKELTSAHSVVFIMGHRMGDLDSIGSATGLCAVLRTIGTDAFVVVDPDKNMAKPLINYIKEQDSMNFYLSPEEALRFSDENPLLIIVDTHNPEILDSKELYQKCSRVVVIDHHRRMVNCIENSVIFYHEPLASSASEMVAELIQYFGDGAKIQAPHAEALLAGIMLDTRNFIMRTGVRTFEAAAFLRKQGADTVRVKSMFDSSIDVYHEKSKLIGSAKLHHGCAIACAEGSNDSLRLASSQAADELLGISDVNASFVLFDEDGTINISARSLGKVNVQLIMEALGGGGHQTMAGAQLKGSMEEVVRKLTAAVDDYFTKNALPAV